jgi:hypothetical protein
MVTRFEELVEEASEERRNASDDDDSGHLAPQPWHPATAAVEALDYEQFESAAPHTSGLARSGYGLAGWLACLFLGVAMAGTALLINLTVENMAGMKYLTTSALLLRHGPAASFAFFATINVCLAVSASAVTVLFAPAAAGSGIGDVKAYLNGVDVPNLLLGSTLATKVLGSAGAVAGGLAVGKEGPFVHIGATIGALAAQGGTRDSHLRWRPLAALRTDRARRDFVTCGASCGVAAAFRAPVGGLLFAMEELSTHWRHELTWLCFAANGICVVTMRVAMRWCAGGAAEGARRCGDFDASGGLFIFNISPETGGQEQARWAAQHAALNLLAWTGPAHRAHPHRLLGCCGRHPGSCVQRRVGATVHVAPRRRRSEGPAGADWRGRSGGVCHQLHLLCRSPGVPVQPLPPPLGQLPALGGAPDWQLCWLWLPSGWGVQRPGHPPVQHA